MHEKPLLVPLLALCLLCPFMVYGQPAPTFTQQEVIYGHKDGMALTMMVYTPKIKLNGKAIIQVVSGGYVSGYDQLASINLSPNVYLERGYTLFAVMHSSQPKYTIPEIIPDIQRAIRFIRYHAKTYQIDPDYMGITGGSSGANLAMLVATMNETIDPKAKDPVDRVSGRVRAVACFYGATDYPNYGNSTKLNEATLADFGLAAAFDFIQWDTLSKTYTKVVSDQNRKAIMQQISPIYHVSPDDPPMLIAHGDADQLVPLQQSEWMVAKLKEAGVPAKLLIKKGGDHGWQGMEQERKVFADWFDQHLK